MDKKYLKVLEEYNFFNGLNPEQIKAFHPYINIKNYVADKIIIKEGDIGNFVFILLEGNVEISQALTLSMIEDRDQAEEFDNREKAFTKLSHEDYPFIGEMSLFNPDQKRSASVKTLSACKIGIIYNDDILKICDENKDAGFQIMKNVGKKFISN